MSSNTQSAEDFIDMNVLRFLLYEYIPVDDVSSYADLLMSYSTIYSEAQNYLVKSRYIHIAAAAKHWSTEYKWPVRIVAPSFLEDLQRIEIQLPWSLFDDF
jgi:hypothetical protein